MVQQKDITKMKNKWLKKFKIDCKERFLNFETLRGLYLTPAGLITCYVSIYHIQYIIQAMGLSFGWYIVSDGLHKILVNRVKQKVKFNRHVASREAGDIVR